MYGGRVLVQSAATTLGHLPFRCGYIYLQPPEIPPTLRVLVQPSPAVHLQGYLAHKKPPPPRALQ
ncbi:hypothetical protein T484DRAFT_1932652 [Baffinella frigidus]|nr:hypothetical protein T484DRAFT_1932652 [Cryptophyta sp. CCMP2293]